MATSLHELAAPVRRREFARVLAGCVSMAFALRDVGAATAKTYHIGFLCPEGEDIPYFFKQLADLGYQEGRNVEYLLKGINAFTDLDGFAAKLIAAKVDVIVACTNDAARVAKRATSSIPIVLLYGVVPVEVGIVESLAKPGGNVTGSAAISLEMVSKSVELFKSTVPRLKKVAVIANSRDPVAKPTVLESQRAADNQGLVASVLEASDQASLMHALAQLTRDPPEGLLANISAFDYFPQIRDYAATHRLPVMYPVQPIVWTGGLMAYAPQWIPQSERNAQIVDRVLKGTHPRDIPVQQPNLYAFVINRKTAREIGLTIPPEVLLRATRVLD